jgi:hypothetical protein
MLKSLFFIFAPISLALLTHLHPNHITYLELYALFLASVLLFVLLVLDVRRYFTVTIPAKFEEHEENMARIRREHHQNILNIIRGEED